MAAQEKIVFFFGFKIQVGTHEKNIVFLFGKCTDERRGRAPCCMRNIQGRVALRFKANMCENNIFLCFSFKKHLDEHWGRAARCMGSVPVAAMLATVTPGPRGGQLPIKPVPGSRWSAKYISSREPGRLAGVFSHTNKKHLVVKQIRCPLANPMCHHSNLNPEAVSSSFCVSCCCMTKEPSTSDVGLCMPQTLAMQCLQARACPKAQQVRK